MIWTAFQWWCNVMGALHNVTGYQKMCPGVTSLSPREKLLEMQEALRSLEAVAGKLSLAFNNWAGFVTTQPQWAKSFVMKLCLHWLLPGSPFSSHLWQLLAHGHGKAGHKIHFRQVLRSFLWELTQSCADETRAPQEGLTFHQSGMPGTGDSSVTVCLRQAGPS